MFDKKETVLSVRNLGTRFMTSSGTVKAVDGVSFDVHKGEIFGIVGESGSGKSVTNLSILRLIPSPPGKIVEGQIILKGKNLLEANENELQMIRGGNVSMIFQDPMTSLNPLLKVSVQIAEVLELHHGLSRKEAEKKVVELLKAVGIPDAERRAQEYPHQFSGGMRQRVMIAMAIGCNPDVLIADEPTTALDVTIQAQILDLIRRLSDSRTMSVILITHDLGVVAGMCDTVAVMYAGRIVEQSAVDPLFREPRHPYTQGLLASVPRLDSAWSERLYSIPGAPPNLADLPAGCAFAPRCAYALPVCRNAYPPLTEMDDAQGGKRLVRCWLHTSENSGEQQ